jgi:hypothetical protein
MAILETMKQEARNQVMAITTMMAAEMAMIRELLKTMMMTAAVAMMTAAVAMMTAAVAMMTAAVAMMTEALKTMMMVKKKNKVTMSTLTTYFFLVQ